MFSIFSVLQTVTFLILSDYFEAANSAGTNLVGNNSPAVNVLTFCAPCPMYIHDLFQTHKYHQIQNGYLLLVTSWRNVRSLLCQSAWAGRSHKNGFCFLYKAALKTTIRCPISGNWHFPTFPTDPFDSSILALGVSFCLFIWYWSHNCGITACDFAFK